MSANAKLPTLPLSRNSLGDQLTAAGFGASAAAPLPASPVAPVRTTIRGKRPKQLRAQASPMRKSQRATSGVCVARILTPAEKSRYKTQYGAGDQCPRCLRWFSITDYYFHETKCGQSSPSTLATCSTCGHTIWRPMLLVHQSQCDRKTYDAPHELLNPTERNPTEPRALSDYEKLRLGWTRCKSCQVLVTPTEMAQHSDKYHAQDKGGSLRGTKQFSFVLLPNSKGTLQGAIEQYCRGTSRTGHGDAGYDWGRLKRIEAMNPVARYVGSRSWNGYVVFEFQNSDKVVLECPRTGNATYVLKGNWREMISETKAELRTEYQHLTTRIIHSDEWGARVRSVIFGNSRAYTRLSKTLSQELSSLGARASPTPPTR